MSTKRWSLRILFMVLVVSACSMARSTWAGEKPRIIVTSDGEIDDLCSMIWFLLYANEWDIEGIITSSSQYMPVRRR